jgi:hypothetical protein
MPERGLAAIARFTSLAVVLLWMASAVAAPQDSEAGTDASIIRFDLSPLDDNGLYGPPDGLRSLDYEFCIPSGEPYAGEVKAIDPSARFHSGSPGRIGCAGDQSLVLGNTHQPDFREILGKLAALPYVTRIDQAFFE